MLGEGKEIECPKRAIIADTAVHITLQSLTTKNSRRLLDLLPIDTIFLDVEPDTWDSNSKYIHACQVVSKLQVVNDVAERGVPLIEDFTGCCTYDEEQVQCLLQL